MIVSRIFFGNDPEHVEDGRVVVGVGPEGHRPRAFVALCPIDGVRDLVADLQRQGAVAAEHHPPHFPPLHAA